MDATEIREIWYARTKQLLEAPYGEAAEVAVTYADLVGKIYGELFVLLCGNRPPSLGVSEPVIYTADAAVELWGGEGSSLTREALRALQVGQALVDDDGDHFLRIR